MTNVKPLQDWTASEVRDHLLTPLKAATRDELESIVPVLDKLERFFKEEIAFHEAEIDTFMKADPSNPAAMEKLVEMFSTSKAADVYNAKNKLVVVGYARKLVADVRSSTGD
jgi:hypothetical protein